MQQAYLLKRDSENSNARAGDKVYDIKYHDYGCANDDTKITGVRHISVTLNENGDYPFFTVPYSDLEKI